MSQFIIKINDAEEKALLTNMVSIQEWLDNAIHEKARRVMDRIIEKETDRQPKKIFFDKKCEIIRDIQLETAIERNAKFLAEIGA